MIVAIGNVLFAFLPPSIFAPISEKYLPHINCLCDCKKKGNVDVLLSVAELHLRVDFVPASI